MQKSEVDLGATASMHDFHLKDATVMSNDLTASTTDLNDTFSSKVTAKSQDDGDPFWIMIMDRSQLAMTLIGVIANIGTSITLIKNRQVSNRDN